jgi:hypothetical protein
LAARTPTKPKVILQENHTSNQKRQRAEAPQNSRAIEGAPARMDVSTWLLVRKPAICLFLLSPRPSELFVSY